MKSRDIAICALLAVLTLAVYWRVTGFELTNLDDRFYVTTNPQVLAGLNAQGARWAFTTTYQANWHPMTWLSLMADAEAGNRMRDAGFEIGPGGVGIYHLTNLLFHLANVLLLFLLLQRLTGSRWRSAFVAGLFAIHPLHVESVAWVAERKDVLSTFFWLLTMLAYLRYVRRPDAKTYAAVVLAFALGLMSKPMLVTLPIVLLLIDYWPLARLGSSDKKAPGFRSLVREKWLLVVMSIASCAATFYAQWADHAVSSLSVVPLGMRADNALVAYAKYLGKAIWPVNLAVYYPHPKSHLPIWQVVVSGLLLAAVTWAAVRLRRTRPYLIVGWLWYVVTLIPVIGLVQVGDQSLADRYTYIPLIGVFVIIAWGVPELMGHLLPRAHRARAGALGAAAAAVIVALALATSAQLSYWRDDEALLTRAISVTQRNSLAHDNLGILLAVRGEMDSAIYHLRKAVEFDPGNTSARYNLGNVYLAQNRLEDAAEQYRAALSNNPHYARARANLGHVLSEEGRLPEAVAQYKLALRDTPDSASMRNNLGSCLMRMGRYDEAIAELTKATELDPSLEAARRNLEEARAAR